MTSVWSTFTFVLLPPAVILLFLMTIPFPGVKGNRAIVKLGDVVFGIRVGPLSIYPSAKRWSVFSIITAISFIVLLAQTYDLQKRYSQDIDPQIEFHYEANLQKKATRWRMERNWWITALTFTIYWMLLRFHAVKKQLLKTQRHED